jgi:hypothetical protein
MRVAQERQVHQSITLQRPPGNNWDRHAGRIVLAMWLNISRTAA